ncbi:hypothetical protein BAMA_10785 [Bacillus manliponensis]|uniref:Uncharacterized protein n=1 Tax=Bacillus manliponensis TaxID=574376 RepID=A0A073JRW6_9BACI|nr:hypothetical protein [Bacillus manliponensis]KEK17834.1 hypothetical protein BAMA_10785 [Bacillus manliponensis]
MIKEILLIGWELITVQMPLYLNIWIALLLLSSVLEGVFKSIQQKRPLGNALLIAVIEGLIVTVVALGITAFGIRLIDWILPGHIEPFSRENTVLFSVIIVTAALVVDVIVRGVTKNKQPIVFFSVVIMAIVVAFAFLFGMVAVFNSAISVSLVVLLIISVSLSLLLGTVYYTKTN